MRAVYIVSAFLQLLALYGAAPASASPTTALIRRNVRDEDYWELERQKARQVKHPGNPARWARKNMKVKSMAEYEVMAVEKAKAEEQLVADQIAECWRGFAGRVTTNCFLPHDFNFWVVDGKG